MSGLALQTLSVRNATNPILMQEAVNAFRTTSPSLNAFLKKGAAHCEAFKQKFPESFVIGTQQSGGGLFKAITGIASFVFHSFSAPLEEYPEDPPTTDEIFPLVLDQGRSGLEEISSSLNRLEDLLMVTGQDVSDALREEIRSIREERFFLESCPPKATQSLDAAKTWAASIDKKLQDADRLVQTVSKEHSAKLLKTGNAAVSKTLRDMVDTPLPTPLSESNYAAIVEDEIGKNTKIPQPRSHQFLKALKPLAERSKDAELIHAVQDAEIFEEILSPFRDELSRYPMRRFVVSGAEYDQVVDRGVKQFSSQLNTMLGELDQKKRSSIYVPLVYARSFLESPGENIMDALQSGRLFSEDHSLLKIVKTGRNYEIRIYQSAPAEKGPSTPYAVIKNVSQKKLTDPIFHKELLAGSSIVSKAEELKGLGEILGNHWNEASNSWRCRHNYPIDCAMEHIFRPIRGAIQDRSIDITRSLEAAFGKAGVHRGSFTNLLERHLGSLESSGQAAVFPGKTGTNPWGVWEALLLGDDKQDLLFDLKLAGLVHLSHAVKPTDLETEILLNLCKASLVSLNRLLSESGSIPKDKFLYAQSVLEEVKGRLVEREQELVRSIDSKISPVTTNPLFRSIDKEVVMPKTYPAISHSPVKSSKAQALGSFSGWTPSATNLTPLNSFAASLDAAYKAENYDGIIQGTKALFDRFNFATLDDRFWNALTERQAENLFLTLDQISNAYFKSYFDANVPKLPEAESGLLMMELMALADKLMPKLPARHNLNLRLPLDSFAPYLYNRGVFFRMADPKLDARLHALRNYFESGSNGRQTLFSTNLSPIKRQLLGAITGDLIAGPRLEMGGHRAYATPDGYYVPEHWDIMHEPTLREYLENFFGDPSLSGLLNIDKIEQMLSRQNTKALPSTFYAAQDMTFRSQYFFRGTFLKPSGFKKTESSYSLSYPTNSVFNLMAPGMGTVMGTLMGSKVYFLFPKVEGIDQSVFDENEGIHDGLASAHQFAHLQRPPVDPIIKDMQQPHLTIQGDPVGTALQIGRYWRNDDFAPGITEAGRNLYDLNVVMVKPTAELKKYLSKQEFEQLTSLRTEPNVQIANTLSFFRGKSNLLRVPDMQSYFTNLIFDPGLLIEELSLPHRGPEIERQLSDFAEGEYHLNQLLNLGASDFYLGLLSRLRQYSLYAREKHPDVYRDAPLPKAFAEFPKTLKTAIDKSTDASRGTLHGLAIQQKLSADSLKPDEVANFLRHAILFNRFPPSGKTVDPLLSADVKRLLGRFAPQIAAVKKDDAFFHSIVDEAYPLPKNAEFLAAPDNAFLFTVKDEPVTIDLQQGLVIAPGLDGVSLPADGLSSPVYTSLYGTEEFRCNPISQSTFEFKDKNGSVNRLVRLLDGEYILQRQFPTRDGRWFQYVPKDILLGENQKKPGKTTEFEEKLKDFLGKFVKALGSKELPILPAMPLIEGHSHWYSTDIQGELLIVDKAGKIAYRADVSGTEILKTESSPRLVTQIYSVSKDKDRALLTDQREASFEWTKNFEDPSQTLIWKDLEMQEPERIEFPRFGIDGLSFTKDGTLFKSDQFAGFFLKKGQKNPLGSHCPNFLLLQNKIGEEKLILAAQKIAPKTGSSLSSRLEFERSERKVGQKLSYFVYDRVNGNKHFTSIDAAANFYLAMIHSSKKRYKDAIILLRQFGKGSNAFTDQEKTILGWLKTIDKTLQDDSAQLLAVKALADILLARNAKDHTDPKAEGDKKASLSDESETAKLYFQRAGSLGLFRLESDEELFLLEEKLFKGSHAPDFERIRKLLTHNPQKAKDAILALGNYKPLTATEVRQILSAPASLFPQTEPLEALALEPIEKDALQYLKTVGMGNGDQLETELKVLFAMPGATDIEQKGLDFYFKDSLEYLKKKDKTEYRLKDLQTLKAKRAELEQTYSYMGEALAQAELAILRLASKLPADSHEKAKIFARAEGNAAAPIEMSDLVLLYMNRNLEELKVRNPELNSEDIKTLDGLIDLYVDLAIQNSQRKRVAVRIGDIEQLSGAREDDPTLQLALQSFAAETKVTRQFDPKENRFLKVFEFHNGFYYRKNQIDKLQELGVQLDHGSEARLFESLVLEMMVGAGKTTYLLPTKGYWSADGKHLSMAVMPEALIGNMSREVERILGKTFAQKVRRFQFDRNTDLSESHLKDILKMLSEAIEKKEYLITTDKSLKAFYNQFTRVLQEAQTNPKMAGTAELMRQIFKVFKTKADVLFDEADLILDPRRELNFPAGELSSLPTDHLAMSLKIFELMTAPDMLKLTSFEFAPSSAKTCTPKVFEEEVKPALVKKIDAFLSQKGEGELADLRKFYQKLTPSEKTALQAYFRGEDPDHKTEHWIAALSNEEARQQFGLIRGLLNVILQSKSDAKQAPGQNQRQAATGGTLHKYFGVRYGFHTPASVLADPFSAADAPNIGSQFSDPFERIAYTIQAYMKIPGMRRPVVEQCVYDLQSKALAESKNSEAIKKARGAYKTKAHLEFEEYFGKRETLDLFQSDIVDRLMDILEKEPKAKIQLMEKYVLPRVQVYSDNQKATSQVNGLLFTNPKGFTGTLWNAGTYHDSFAAKYDDGARGQVVALAYSQAKGKVSTITVKDPAKLRETLILDNPKYGHIKALIDAGGALREFKLEETAKIWLDRLTKAGSPVQGVVFFNEKDQAYIWQKGESSPIPLAKSDLKPHQRITIYDQKHTTGTDIKQAIDAVALVTVSKNMIMRDFIQAVGRMRQLASGQRIEIALLDEDAQAIREILGLAPNAELGIQEVIRFLILNEVSRQGEDNQVATNHKLTAVVQEWFLNKVLAAKNVQEILKHLADSDFIKNLFFQSSSTSPFENYGRGTDLVDTTQVYQSKADALIGRLGLPKLVQTVPFFGGSPGLAEVKKLMEAVIQKSKAVLPAQVKQSSYSGDMEEEQEVQQEQETQQEQQQQQEELQDKSAGREPWAHARWYQLTPDSVERASVYQAGETGDSDAFFLKASDVAPKGSQIFSDNLLLSHNFQLNHQGRKGRAVKPFGEFQKPVQNILIVEDQKTKYVKLMILEPYDAAAFKSALQQKQNPEKAPLKKDPDLTNARNYNRWENDFFSEKNDWICLEATENTNCDSYFYGYTPSTQPSGNSVKVWIGDLSLNSLYQSNPPLSSLKSDAVANLIVQAKYFNGEVNYNEEDRKRVKAWLSDQAGKSWLGGRIDRLNQMEQDFRGTIIAFKEESKRDYPRSDLFKIFKELREES